MRRFVVLLATAVLIVAGPVSGQTVLSFDDIAPGPLAPDYGGLDWDAGWAVYDDAQPPYNPSSSPARAFFCSDCGGGGVDFFAPVTFLGAYFSGFPDDGVSTNLVWFELFLSGNPVYISGVLNPSNVATFLASGYGGLVDRVVARNNLDANYWVMDDFTFDAQVVGTVPEPASMTLLATGLAGLAAARRRKRNKG